MIVDRPRVLVVSHTHWDREWHQPFEVFRLRLCATVEELLDLLDEDPAFAHFMLDGQTICVDDVLAVRPSLRARLLGHIASGRIGVGPWYVLQDEFLVGAESIVRNLAEGLRSARAFGRAMPIGYLPDAFGHIAQMPRILRGFELTTAVVWRGVGDRAPGSEWRWRAPSGAEVLCLFLPGGYGNAASLGSDEHAVVERLRGDLARVLPLSPSSTLLWMNGNDHRPVEREVPRLLGALRRAFPDVEIEHTSLERAVASVRDRVDTRTLPVVEGELRRGTPEVPVLAGVWSARTWDKRQHDEAQASLVRYVEPFVALAGLDRREALRRAWRLLLECQPHDTICGCSIDEVHREARVRLHGVQQLAGALLAESLHAILDEARTPDFAIHQGLAIVNPHPFAASGACEVELQRYVADLPFRLVGPTGEVSYEILERWASQGPDLGASEWLRLRLRVDALPPLGLRRVSIERGEPATQAVVSPLVVREIDGGLEIEDPETGLVVSHTFEDEGDRGDLYDFCPTGETPRGSREHELGVRVIARPVGRRVEIDVELDHAREDHRLRARFDLSPTPPSIFTDTPFDWQERTTPGTHPVSTLAYTSGTPRVALGGLGLHELERGPDGAFFLTLIRAVGRMSKGDLSTRAGHAGYAVRTPDAQGLGRHRFRYCVAIGPDAVREVEACLFPPRAIPLGAAGVEDRAFLAIEPSDVRLSIAKRADEGPALLVRLTGPPGRAVEARLTLPRAIARAYLSDLDERVGPALPFGDRALTIAIPADEVVTVGIE